MAQRRARLYFIIVLLYLGSYCESTSAKTFLVGGSTGWTYNISNWPPKGTTFHAGDVLEFLYDPRDHNVVVVDKHGYETCKASKGASQKNSGNDQVFLEKGANYFIYTKRGDCEKGMKKAINAE